MVSIRDALHHVLCMCGGRIPVGIACNARFLSQMQLAQSESQQSFTSVTSTASDMLESPSDAEAAPLVNSEAVASPSDESGPGPGDARAPSREPAAAAAPPSSHNDTASTTPDGECRLFRLAHQEFGNKSKVIPCHVLNVVRRQGHGEGVIYTAK